MGKEGKTIKRNSTLSKNVFCVPKHRIRKSKDKKSKPVTTNLKWLKQKTKENVKMLDENTTNIQEIKSNKQKIQVQNFPSSSTAKSTDINSAIEDLKNLCS